MALKRIHFEALLVLLYRFVIVAQCVSDESTRRNVVLIIIPNFRFYISTSSESIPYTPNLDLFSSSSLIFHNVYTQIPSPVASRNSLFSSRRPDSLKSYDNSKYDWKNIVTMPEYFKQNGYHTVSIGNVFPGGNSLKDNKEAEAWLGKRKKIWSLKPIQPTSAQYDKEANCLFLDKNDTIKASSCLVCPVIPGATLQHMLPDEEIIEIATKFIHDFEKQDNNFFLSIGFYRPQVPFRYPLQYLTMNPLKQVIVSKLLVRPGGLHPVAMNSWTKLKQFDDIQHLNLTYPFGVLTANDSKIVAQSYFATLTYIDDLIGQLFKEMGTQLMFQDTVVAVVGDHGSSLGEKGMWGGYSTYDVATKVPLLIYCPDLTTHMRVRKVTHQLVELVDLYPTLVELAGLDPLPQCPMDSSSLPVCTEGVSLGPLFESIAKKNKDIDNWKSAVFIQVPRANIFPNESVDRDEPPNAKIAFMGYAVRTKRFKYVEWVEFKNMTPNWENVTASELYDFQIDCTESLNLADKPHFSTTKAKLQEMLKKGWRHSLPTIKNECQSTI